MKRISVIAVLSVLCGQVMAQDTLDVDTLWGPHSHYMYQFWDDSACRCYHDGMLCYRTYRWREFGRLSTNYGMQANDSCACSPQYCDLSWVAAARETAVGYHVDTAVRVIGMAVAVSDYAGGMTEDCHLPELKLYKPVGPQMNLIESRTLDTNVHQHMMYVTDGGHIPSHDSIYYYKVYEVYFDSAVTMTDSFYLAWVHNDWYYHSVLYPYECHLPLVMTEPIWHNTETQTGHCPHRYPLQTFRRKSTTDPDEPWLTFTSHAVAFLMPILEYSGDTCMPVSGLRWRRWGEDAAWVQWDGVQWQNHWQLSYGPEGIMPEDGTIIDCKYPTRVLYDMDTTARYTVYVRARCNGLPYRPWTGWSRVTMDMERGGIDNVPVPGLTVTPNPTSGRLMVQCTEEMTGLDVYSLQGQPLQSQACAGPTAEVDLGGLRAGSYMLVVTTRQGQVTRKVVKQ